ncbi:MAG: hypothetical protein ACOYNY_30185 [Caldilineaceae bacterium]
MRDRSKLRERFLRDRVAIQLGNIASNLGRIDSFITTEMEQPAITDLFDETKVMIDWAAPSATLEQQFILIELQRSLVRWRFAWDSIAQDASQRAGVAGKAREWSDQLITISGLLDEDPLPTANQPENPIALVATFS